MIGSGLANEVGFFFFFLGTKKIGRSCYSELSSSRDVGCNVFHMWQRESES